MRISKWIPHYIKSIMIITIILIFSSFALSQENNDTCSSLIDAANFGSQLDVNKTSKILRKQLKAKYDSKTYEDVWIFKSPYGNISYYLENTWFCIEMKDFQSEMYAKIKASCLQIAEERQLRKITERIVGDYNNGVMFTSSNLVIEYSEIENDKNIIIISAND
ncbi:MAG: hypothetical protein AAF600_09710 [Bacteroidota bacterium]